MSGLKSAVFLDRDGTVIREYGHFWEPNQIQLIPGAAGAIRRLKAAGFLAVLATNQSGIARGIFTEAQFWVGHRRLEALLAEEGVKLDAVYFCPHHPTEGERPYRGPCECRKPQPGMLLQGARERGIDLPRSYMVGDSAVDVGAGKAAGVRTVRVDTTFGLGISPSRLSDLVEAQAREGPAPDHKAADLDEASRWILKQRA